MEMNIHRVFLSEKIEEKIWYEHHVEREKSLIFFTTMNIKFIAVAWSIEDTGLR